MSPPAYFDHDSGSSERVRAFSALGIDVLTSEAAGNQLLSDPEQLEFAKAHGRILITANARDFERIHREYMEAAQHHAGILIVLQQTRISSGELARRYVRMSTSLAEHGAADRLMYVQEFGES